ncbi:MAG: hypothetical protein DRJ65_06030 [Acidobacteria bacterium]|nr:MAG: hypothetical protein DRJ65_06030 [Acidobacteriota bacterium]
MTGSSEKRSGLEDFPFSFRATGQEKVLIYWRGEQVIILKGGKARGFLLKISNADAPEQQMVMAKITGNFKRGNEHRR